MRTIWVPNSASSAATVRSALSTDLTRAGVERDVSEDATLLASELVGNAVRHARALPSGYLAVSWDVMPTGVRVQVTDGGGNHRPQIRTINIDDTSGRGLAIVAALASDWGVDERPDGTTVWATLAREYDNAV